jgi:choline dehydrogenase-like flavoprotein
VVADARALSEGAELQADVCVVGAGPVGLVLARELEPAGLNVCILESGSLDPAENTRHPLGGELAGDDYLPLEHGRARGFAGTATIWTSEVARNALGARYGLLQAIDFERRPDVPHSGWPFDLAHLLPYYERAAAICGIAPLDADAKLWESPPRAVRLDLGEDVTTRIVRYGFQSVFTRDYLDWAHATRTVTVYLNARALEIETDGGSTATRVRAASAPGRTFHVVATAFVLALGGIENARLLLLSTSTSENGVGNQHDLVGRFFMDHPTASCALAPAGPRAVERLALYDTLRRDGRVAQGSLGLTDEAMRSKGILNSGSIVAPTIDRKMRALQSAATVGSALARGRRPTELVRNLRNAALGADAIAAAVVRRIVEKQPALEPVARLWPTVRLLNTLDIGHVSGWSRLPLPGRRFPAFGLFQMIEQAPEPDRRITLSSTKDEFGQPLARLNWFISERELDSMDRTQTILASAFARAAIGRLVTTRELSHGSELQTSIFPSAYHHLGTTRMHRDPKQGVVNENGRVHGMTNLFVGGTSVFPTGGYVNPTLTAVAMAVRLADHVSEVVPALQRNEP